MLLCNDLESIKKASIKEMDINLLNDISCLRNVDLSLPLSRRLEAIIDCLGSPYMYISSNGIKIKINHIGKQTIDEVLFEHFIKNQ
ncbi:MAG: hypothetical protein LBR74_00915 [Eubacterium sp.]|jgi:hypothetical protein|nr:hypothetical protein [Eubacterium sp.]